MTVKDRSVNILCYERRTSTILLTKIWKSPNISQTNTEAEDGEEELDRTVPGDPGHTLHINGIFTKLYHLDDSFINLHKIIFFLRVLNVLILPCLYSFLLLIQTVEICGLCKRCWQQLTEMQKYC